MSTTRNWQRRSFITPLGVGNWEWGVYYCAICVTFLPASCSPAPCSRRGPRPPRVAQHETAADLLDGERAYPAARCANCHGPDGDLIPGIDFGRGQFRRPMTDDDLVRIIRTGHPEHADAGQHDDRRAGADRSSPICARWPPARRAGAITRRRGARQDGLRQQGRTARHATASAAPARRQSPDLTQHRRRARRAGSRARAASIRPADVQPNHRFYRVVTARRHDGHRPAARPRHVHVQLLDTKEQLRSFVKSDLREHGFIDSPMPSYKDTLTPQELADVVSYLSRRCEGADGGTLMPERLTTFLQRLHLSSARRHPRAAAASLQAQVTFDRILNGATASRTTGSPTPARRRTSATARSRRSRRPT